MTNRERGSNSVLLTQHLLNLHQTLPFRLRHEHSREEECQGACAREGPEQPMASNDVDRVSEECGDHEAYQPGCGDGEG